MSNSETELKDGQCELIDDHRQYYKHYSKYGKEYTCAQEFIVMCVINLFSCGLKNSAVGDGTELNAIVITLVFEICH